VKDWDSLFTDACQIVFQLGPYLCARHEVAIKLIRLLNLFYDATDAENLENYEDRNTHFLIFINLNLNFSLQSKT
jgi:hypothetical protein